MSVGAMSLAPAHLGFSWYHFAQSGCASISCAVATRRIRSRVISLRDFQHAVRGDHAPAFDGRETGAHKLDHLLDTNPIRQHDRLGAAVAAGGEQFERAVRSGLGRRRGRGIGG
jgi:hypothetical protein